jgi:hypothetical protein
VYEFLSTAENKFSKMFRRKSPLPASGYDVSINKRHLGHRSSNNYRRHLDTSTKFHGV